MNRAAHNRADTRPIVNSKLAYLAANRLNISEITGCHSINTFNYKCFCPIVSQAVQPLVEYFCYLYFHLAMLVDV